MLHLKEIYPPKRGLVSKETVLVYRWGYVDTNVLPNELNFIIISVSFLQTSKLTNLLNQVKLGLSHEPSLMALAPTSLL